MSSILLIEDTAIAREPLARLLAYEGFDVRCANNGVEGLAAVAQRVPDLILLDVMMPKMNGVEFLRELRGHDTWASIPVIAITGVLASAALQDLQHHGVMQVLHKAKFTVDELLSEIEHAGVHRGAPTRPAQLPV